LLRNLQQILEIKIIQRYNVIRKQEECIFNEGRRTRVEEKGISKAVISRLPRYYRYLGELLDSGVERISSGELSQTDEGHGVSDPAGSE
jgi:hypothetical protein